MAYDVEKLHRMENALRTTACLVGKSSASLNEDGFKVGLGLTNEADICQNAADAVKEKAISGKTFFTIFPLISITRLIPMNIANAHNFPAISDAATAVRI